MAAAEAKAPDSKYDKTDLLAVNTIRVLGKQSHVSVENFFFVGFVGSFSFFLYAWNQIINSGRCCRKGKIRSSGCTNGSQSAGTCSLEQNHERNTKKF